VPRQCRDCGIADHQPCICTDAHQLREEEAERLADPCPACQAPAGAACFSFCETNRTP